MSRDDQRSRASAQRSKRRTVLIVCAWCFAYLLMLGVPSVLVWRTLSGADMTHEERAQRAFVDAAIEDARGGALVGETRAALIERFGEPCAEDYDGWDLQFSLGLRPDSWMSEMVWINVKLDEDDRVSGADVVVRD